MKAILTYYAIFSFGVLAVAQEAPMDINVELTKSTVTLQGDTQIKKRNPKFRSVARVYLFKNSRTKKELKFRTKRNKAKLT